jgi:hypothetical protein
MASKQTLAREAQGYATTPKNCGNCAHRKSERTLPAWMVEANSRHARLYTIELHGRETNLRCGIGGFAIKKTASCLKWSGVELEGV